MSRKELIEMKINALKCDIEETKGKIQFKTEEIENLEIDLKNYRKELECCYQDLKRTLN